jgi:hypothetical protein
MRSNARLYTSHHGLQHPFKDAEVDADDLTGIHHALVKCFITVTRSCIYKAF